MESGGTPIQRVRTFADDFARAKAKAAPSETGKVKKPLVAMPKVSLPKQAPSAPAVEKVTATPPKVPRIVSLTEKTTPVVPKVGDKFVPLIKNEIKLAKKETETKITLPRKDQPTLAVDVSEVKHLTKESLLSNREKIFDVFEENQEVSEGSIITDRKRDRFKLFPAMAEALRGWFGKQKEAVATYRRRQELKKPTVIDPKMREHILVEAGKKSLWAPKDDFAALQKNIRRPEKTETVSGTLVIKKPFEVQKPTWTQVVEEEKASVAEEKTSEELPEETGPTLITAEESVLETEPEVIEEVEIVKEPIVGEVYEPAEPGVPIDEQLSALLGEEGANETETNTEAYIAEEANPYSDELEPTENTPVYKVTSQPVSLPIRIWLRLTLVAVLSILLGTATTLWLFSGDEGDAVVTPETTSLIRSEEQIAIPLGGSASEFLRHLLEARSRPTTVVAELYPTVSVAGEIDRATVEQVLATLDLRAPGTFVRNITDINFGLYRNIEPFIVLKVTSFDAAFGGLLTWETGISADLSPFFGAPVTGTFDPEDRTATQIRPPFFKDTVVANLDGRLLTDETQKERLIYAFLDRNTVVLTTSKSALEAIINAIK